jgi:hypothetical protein
MPFICVGVMGWITRRLAQGTTGLTRHLAFDRSGRPLFQLSVTVASSTSTLLHFKLEL